MKPQREPLLQIKRTSRTRFPPFKQTNKKKKNHNKAPERQHQMHWPFEPTLGDSYMIVVTRNV